MGMREKVRQLLKNTKFGIPEGADIVTPYPYPYVPLPDPEQSGGSSGNSSPSQVSPGVAQIDSAAEPVPHLQSLAQPAGAVSANHLDQATGDSIRERPHGSVASAYVPPSL